MSQTDTPDLPPRPRTYKPGMGSDRYAAFAEDWLGVTRTHVLDTILETLEEHQQVVVIGGNGIGKSFFVGVGGLAALYCNPHTIVHVTAGTSSTLKNNIWKPTRGLFKDAERRWGESNLPGRTLDGTREIRTEISPKWYFECVSPKYPDDLEGPHNDNVIYFIEEADKPGVTDAHIDSVRSTVTDKDDRVCVVANPPTDEGNVVHKLLQSDEWKTLVFPSWDSHNVRLDRGLDEGEEIGGLATSWKMQQDWEEYHDEPWPGLEQAIRWSDPGFGTGESYAIAPADPPNEEFRDDLHETWYKRRAGIVPPQSSTVWRPFYVSAVNTATNNPVPDDTTPRALGEPLSMAFDIARKGGDRCSCAILYPSFIDVTLWNDTDHNENRSRIQRLIKGVPGEPPVAIDAVGQGSPIADWLSTWHPKTARFKSGKKGIKSDEYYDMWTEGLVALAGRLEDVSMDSPELREELYAAARTLELDEKRRRSGDVVRASSKEDVTDYLGHSPDALDGAMMAAWMAMYDSGMRKSGRSRKTGSQLIT